MQKRICIVITSRASYARCRTVLEEIQAHDGLQLQTVVAASALVDRYGDVREDMAQRGIMPSFECHCLLAGENPSSMARTTGLLIEDLTVAFTRLHPDLVVVIADRHETLAASIAARYLNIPVAHIQGGEITGSIDNSVRWANTMLANYHFCATKKSAERLKSSGQVADTVFMTGCPSLDIARMAKDKPFPDLAKYGGVGKDITFEKNKYFLLTFHPDTLDYGSVLDHGASVGIENQMIEILKALAILDTPTIGLWPNPDAGSDGISKAIRRWQNTPINNTPIRFFKSFSPDDYIVLLANAKCCIGNSSSFVREGSFLGIPATIVGSRQDHREGGGNMWRVMAQHDEIVKCTRTLVRQAEVYGAGRAQPSALYGDGYSGKRIAAIISGLELDCRKEIVL